MKNLINKVRNHGKKLTIHLKRHHRKYLFGAFCSGILAMIVVHTMGTINNIFANEESGVTISYDSGANITYVDTEGNEFTGLGTITISNGIDSITMLDRNLGAITDDITSTGSYGYHFQWGNNYGFDPFDDSVQLNATSGETVDTTGYGPGNYYSGNVFMESTGDWSNPANNNLWGGSGDDSDNNRGYPVINPTDRQGPCPDGYHIPSKGEWGTLFTYWIDYYTGAGNEIAELWYQDDFPSFGTGNDEAAGQFQVDFKLSLAGFRQENTSQRDNTYFEASGFYSSLWSSTSESERSNMFFVSSSYVQSYNVDNRARGNSIRCFKNEEDVVSPTCNVSYNKTWPTSQNVIAYLTGCSEEITGTDLQHTFTGNGIYTFEFQDLAGNTGSTNAEVTWMTSVSYDSGANITYTDTEGNVFTGIGTITITNGTSSIVMLDRNLGATTNDINNTGSYGYHFQWGNNYGFASCYTSGCDSFPNGENVGTTRVATANWYGPNYSWYVGSTFILTTDNPYDWANPSNNNLWGGSGDSADNGWGLDSDVPDTDRQGPCPNGFHVPSYGEFLKVKDMMDIEDIHSKLLIPFAGTRNMVDAKLSGLGDLVRGSIWSSTLYNNSEYYEARSLSVSTGGLGLVANARSYALSVRCFKNTTTGHNSANNAGADYFQIKIPESFEVGEPVDFTIRAMKDGKTFTGYVGLIYITLTDEDGDEIRDRYYTLSDGSYYEFTSSDKGKKTFEEGLTVKREGKYIIKIDSINGGMGDFEITVGKVNKKDDFEYDTLRFNPNFSEEDNKAYQYAYYYGITTTDSIKNANMYSGLTRIAMAKMLSQYAINVLGIQPDTSRNCTFRDVSSQLDYKYDNGVTKACQLGIMGVNTPNNNFYPNGYVSRAEFATALSRLLYNTEDGVDKYYTTHINKLRKEGILTNTTPTLKEKRGFVMLMLMRAGEKYDD